MCVYEAAHSYMYYNLYTCIRISVSVRLLIHKESNDMKKYLFFKLNKQLEIG